MVGVGILVFLQKIKHKQIPTCTTLWLVCPAVQQFPNLYKYNKYFTTKYILSSTHKYGSLLQNLDSKLFLCPHLVISPPTDSYSSIRMIELNNKTMSHSTLSPFQPQRKRDWSLVVLVTTEEELSMCVLNTSYKLQVLWVCKFAHSHLCQTAGSGLNQWCPQTWKWRKVFQTVLSGGKGSMLTFF